MSTLELDAQYELASKIQNLIMFVGLLSDDEIAALKELKKSLHDSNSKTSSVAGLLVPLEKAEHKIKRQSIMIKRIDAFIQIAASNNELQDADRELDDKLKGKEKLEELFGL